MDTNKLFDLNELVKERVKKYKKRRPFYEILKNDRRRHFSGIVGSRGIGKTVLLRQLACEQKDSFYISLDSDEDIDLFELIKTLIGKYGIKTLLLDEIHFLPDYA